MNLERVCSKERHIPASPANEHPSIAGLSETFDAALHDDGDDGRPLDIYLGDSVATGVSSGQGSLVDLVVYTLIMLTTHDGSVVTYADEDGTSLRIAEGDDRLLDRMVAGAGLALDGFGFPGDKFRESGSGVVTAKRLGCSYCGTCIR